MSDFTIEQLEAMKEKSAEGPWDWGYHKGSEVIVDATGEPVLWAEASNSEAFLDVAAGAGHLLVAGPELLDALIAEKRAHQKLRAEVEAMREDWGRKAERSASARDNSEHPAKAAHARHLKAHQHVIRRITRILEGDNG